MNSEPWVGVVGGDLFLGAVGFLGAGGGDFGGVFGGGVVVFMVGEVSGRNVVYDVPECGRVWWAGYLKSAKAHGVQEQRQSTLEKTGYGCGSL